jgi:hypothetical protein
MTRRLHDFETKFSELRNFISQVRPLWKQTWEDELQAVVHEQKFLKEQDKALSVMYGDFEQVTNVVDQIKQFIDLKPQSRGARRFEPKPVDEFHDGLKTVLQEIQSIDINSEKRLRSLAHHEKLRQLERDQNDDDVFSKELGAFISSKKLKKTGGVDAVERERRKKEKELLKHLYALQ